MCLRCKSNSLKSNPGCSQYLNELIYLKDLAIDHRKQNYVGENKFAPLLLSNLKFTLLSKKSQ